MANKISNPSYDQIPHIVKNHPETNPEHWAIMICLFKVLKDKSECIYSTEKLAQDCRMTLRTTERRLSELKKMMLIKTIGTSYNRRISLGLLFYTSAIVADKNSTPPPKEGFQPAKQSNSDRQGGGYNKRNTNHSTKVDSSSKTSKPKAQVPEHIKRSDYAHYLKSFETLGLDVDPKEYEEWEIENYE